MPSAYSYTTPWRTFTSHTGYWSGAQVVLRFDQILFTVKSEHELAKTP